MKKNRKTILFSAAILILLSAAALFFLKKRSEKAPSPDDGPEVVNKEKQSPPPPNSTSLIGKPHLEEEPFPSFLEEMAPGQTPGIGSKELTYNEELYGYCETVQAEMGPNAQSEAYELLASAMPEERVKGAALLGDLGVFGQDIMDAIAEDPDPAVPFKTLGYWIDAGVAEYEEMLTNILTDKGMETEQLMSLARSENIGSGGARAILRVLHNSLAPEEAAALHQEISADSSFGYDVRMQSLRLLRDNLDSASYRQSIELLQFESDPDSEWGAGLQSLSSRLQGSESSGQASEAISRARIDIELARDHPRKLGDLAGEIEATLTNDDVQIETGTSAYLTEQLGKLSEQQYIEEQLAIRRLDSLADRLATAEENEGVATDSALSQPTP